MRGERTERLIRIASRFLATPSQQISLTLLAESFDVSKTVISDDVAIIASAFQEEGIGNLIVEKGRTGGASFIPTVSAKYRTEFLTDMAEVLSNPDRLLPGGLIYYTDILFNPKYASVLGSIMASEFIGTNANVVVTSEVKGIPFGLATAKALGVPLALCRFRNRASDGPAVTIHFPMQNGDIRAMYIGTKQLNSSSKVIIVDDIMRGGSTIAGMCQLIKEFDAKLVGIGAFLMSQEPERKAISGVKSLLTLNNSNPRVTVQAKNV